MLNFVMKSAASRGFPSIQQKVKDSFLLPFSFRLMKTALQRPCPNDDELFCSVNKLLLFDSVDL